ncbi:monosaccharide transporter-like protein [Cucurbitaria berberidis CBS 394.84]|uniref:Monosaccharide transporter-like protein n=1 Tax=Cucurbitaria berberidis CBS 394.84 TaxID=1168544 RepID=A0A9P4GGG5_9PLEO|nr:monosaccharide transporter-like protein [Cucurbitaria berberidis CBS 394.84]KAF1844811.1 monosaccharide transporter-like protein [Cucurbitaria berberidis CBS 394.84]
MAEIKGESWRSHGRLFLACGIVILSPFQYGFDFGMIGGLQAMRGFLQVFGYRTNKTVTGWNITTERQQLISSLMTLGAFISAATAGIPSTRIGRRMCLVMACVTCFVANIIMMTTDNIGALYAGRLIIGLANGYFMTFSQLYIQESSTAELRGVFLTAFNFFVSFGTLIGTIVDWATAKRPDKTAYLIPLGLIYVFPFIIICTIWFIPESPRWLLLQGRFEDGVKSLEWLRPKGHDSRAEALAIQTAIDKEKESSSGVGWLDMFSNPVDRRRTTLAVCAILLQAASGSMFIIAYKAYFLQMAKVSDPFAMSNILSAISICAFIANSFIVVRYGNRRVLLMTGLLVCGIVQLIIAVVYHKQPGRKSTGKVTVGLTGIYMFSYNGMISTYAWLSGGELPTQRLRSHTFGLAASAGFVGAWLTTFTAPYFINPMAMNWGPRYGFIWFPSCVISATWVFFFLPEVKNRTLEEIDEMFEARLGARKFGTYKCVGIAATLDAEARKSIEYEKEVTVMRSEKVAAESAVTRD